MCIRDSFHIGGDGGCSQTERCRPGEPRGVWRGGPARRTGNGGQQHLGGQEHHEEPGRIVVEADKPRENGERRQAAPEWKTGPENVVHQERQAAAQSGGDEGQTRKGLRKEEWKAKESERAGGME